VPPRLAGRAIGLPFGMKPVWPALTLASQSAVCFVSERKPLERLIAP